MTQAYAHVHTHTHTRTHTRTRVQAHTYTHIAAEGDLHWNLERVLSSSVLLLSAGSKTAGASLSLSLSLLALAGAGLRPVDTEGTYVQEGDLLNMPAKRRGSPRPATQNGAVLSE